MKVSVIILTHNQEWHLGYIMTSLKNQTMLPSEVIIVDDNSNTDYLFNVSEEYPFEIKKIKLSYPIAERDRRATARNKGYAMSSGEAIIFVDGDTFLKRDYIEKTLSLLQDKIILCGHRADVISNSVYELINNRDELLSPMGNQKINLPYYYFESNNFSMLRTDEILFDANFRGWGYEDTDFAYRFINKGYKIIKAMDLMVCHLNHPGNNNKMEMTDNIKYFIKKFPFEEQYNFLYQPFSHYGLNLIELVKLGKLIKAENYHLNICEIELTLDCNLKCKRCNRLCDTAPSKEEMALETVQTFVDESIKINKKWWCIRLLGGEPTLYSKLSEVFKILKRYKDFNPTARIEIFTNGLNEELCKTFPDWIIIEDTGKKGRGNDLLEHDLFCVNLSDYTKDKGNMFCSQRSYQGNINLTRNICGIALTSNGYFLCGASRAINRIFKLINAPKSLELFLDNFKMYDDASRVLCKYCGHRIETREYIKENKIKDTVSKTWAVKLLEYNKGEHYGKYQGI